MQSSISIKVTCTMLFFFVTQAYQVIHL